MVNDEGKSLLEILVVQGADLNVVTNTSGTVVHLAVFGNKLAPFDHTEKLLNLIYNHSSSLINSMENAYRPPIFEAVNIYLL